ncbi:HsdM family class I SAM-dependent methyltransferase [Halorientalis marina]|uniref:HsdM family class I SAM-dependent methyltransferase n=1 Tax=Halorientalis marina TaxID=2931976 RepID=UPI001FF330AE|nr:N-6 DNA methylase [Halorientalis marina]
MPNSPAKEAEFHGKLFTRLADYISNQSETVYEQPISEKTVGDGFADIYVPSPLNGDLVIEVKRDTEYPRDREVVKQARGYADGLNTEFFATCTSTDFFLFHYQGEYNVAEIDFVYFDLRDTDLTEFVAELLSAVKYIHQEGDLPNQQERTRIVGILRSFHTSVWPTYKAIAAEKHGHNEQFTRAFDDWIRENDYLDRDADEQYEIAAKQYAYLLTNRVLFYEVVREKTRAQYEPEVGGMVTPIETESGFPLDPLTDYTTTTNLDRHLRHQFQHIIDEVDYRPIFEEHSDLFGAFPDNKKSLRMLEDFVANIESEQVTELDEDLLGEVYEQLIPADERRALGQFYTDPRIAKTLSQWAIGRPNESLDRPSAEVPRVLDPACGSGTFTVEAYNILSNLHPDALHQEIIDRLVAVDINRFPLHLTALNLSSRNIQEETDHLHVFHDSFFNLDPDTNRLIDTRIDAAEGEGERLGMFDAVVGNPPYIRQGNLHPSSDHFRSHLSAFGRDGYSTYLDGSKGISGKSDAYVYFITHATQFLREGGRLGFIIPNKWLTTRYGESLQQFLYDHYKIQGVVGFTARAFEDALVDTVLLLIERTDDEQARADTTTPFIRIREPMDAEDILDTVAVDYEVPDGSYMQIRDRPAYRVTAVEQSYLMEKGPGKLLPYIRAPSEFIELLEHPDLVPVDGDLGTVTRGVMTGSNGFFFVSEAERQDWQIDKRFLKPAIKSISDVDSRVVTWEDTQKYLFDIHDYVAEVERENAGLASDSDLETRVKNALGRDGFDGAYNYIEWGERQGHHTGATCENRDVWFDLGGLEAPELLHPKFFDERVYTIANPDRLMPSNAIDCINFNPDVDGDAMVGFYSSTVYKSLLETWGRAEGGGALQLMTYEVSSVPVLDVRTLSRDVQEELAELADRLIGGDPDAQDDIDRLVLDILGLDISVDRFRELYDSMVQRRITTGAEAAVQVDEVAEFEGEATRTFSRPSGEETDLSEFM